MLSGRGPKGERGFKNIFLFMLFYRVHHAIIQNLDQKLQKTENFYFATIFKVKHRMSSYISNFFRRSIRMPMSMIPDNDC